MSTSSEFLFNSKAKYLDTSLSNTSDKASYLLSSTFAERSDRMPQVTMARGPYGRQGSIIWPERALELDGVRLAVEEIRFKEKGPGSLFSHRWSYQNTQWRVKFVHDAKAWNVFRVVGEIPEGNPTVVFKLYQSSFARKSLPASITFQSSVSEADAIFILLVVLYSELTQHRPPSFFPDILGSVARAAMIS
ncbi:hypothetical protein FPV67DRAFT_506946 [Lyophyllum atratum]|nr:hypothetical protein FPV67DRAFT_506946 [Lyophyllum atratum]